jgi:hypothetical protein
MTEAAAMVPSLEFGFKGGFHEENLLDAEAGWLGFLLAGVFECRAGAGAPGQR